jgi:hypothetical protein
LLGGDSSVPYITNDNTPTVLASTNESADCFASIDGDESYYRSWNITTLTVGSAPQAAPEYPQSIAPIDYTPLFAGIIAAIAVIAVLVSSTSAQSEKVRLNVDRLIEEALQNNPEISAAKMKWEVFKEKIPQAYALEDPMFGFGIVSLPTNFSLRMKI